MKNDKNLVTKKDLNDLAKDIEESEYVTAQSLNDLRSYTDTKIAAIPVATSSANGLMSSTDKSKLDDIVPEKMTNITWANLKDLRDNSQLVPGQWYRITDYVTTTVQVETQSAGHPFDVIVRADATNSLNENAFATLHEGDSYFSDFDAKLDAWKLKYSIDNDITKFAWADTTNGKGVIYYMKDEWNNECPYDFKNIQFKRYKITQSNVGFVNHYYACKDNSIIYPQGVTINTNDYKYFYTFHFAEDSDDDGSVYSNSDRCYDNIILHYYNNSKLTLNNIVILDAYDGNSNSNIFNIDSCANTFGYCDTNVFGQKFCHNVMLSAIGNNIDANYVANVSDGFFAYNTIGYNLTDCIFGFEFMNNTIGNNCRNIQSGDTCINNIIESHCEVLVFGNSCECNVIKCYSSATFGNWCACNTLESYISNVTFGNHCNNNNVRCTSITIPDFICNFVTPLFDIYYNQTTKEYRIIVQTNHDDDLEIKIADGDDDILFDNVVNLSAGEPKCIAQGVVAQGFYYTTEGFQSSISKYPNITYSFSSRIYNS